MAMLNNQRVVLDALLVISPKLFQTLPARFAFSHLRDDHCDSTYSGHTAAWPQKAEFFMPVDW